MRAIRQHTRDLTRYAVSIVLCVALFGSNLPSEAEPHRIKLLLETLNSKQSDWKRQGAAYQLGQQKDPSEAVVKELISESMGSSWPVAYECLRSLVQLGVSKERFSKTVNRFVDGLHNKDSAVRLLATKAMALVGAPSEAFPILTSNLRDRVPEIAQATLLALASSRTSSVRAHLELALSSTDWQTRQIAAQAIGRYGDPTLGDRLAIALHDPI